MSTIVEKKKIIWEKLSDYSVSHAAGLFYNSSFVDHSLYNDEAEEKYFLDFYLFMFCLLVCFFVLFCFVSFVFLFFVCMFL